MRKRHHLISCADGVNASVFDAADEEGHNKLERGACDLKPGKFNKRLPPPWSEAKEAQIKVKQYKQSPVMTAEMAFLMGGERARNDY